MIDLRVLYIHSSEYFEEAMIKVIRDNQWDKILLIKFKLISMTKLKTSLIFFLLFLLIRYTEDSSTYIKSLLL